LARIRQRPLSIFLLKEGIRSAREAVRDPKALDWFDATDEDALIAVRRQTEKAPWWVGYLTPHLEPEGALRYLVNSSTSALLFIGAVNRHFAFAFGYGRHLLNPEAYEYDFGLKVVLNTVEPDQLVSVDARTFDELTMHTRRDVSRGSAFGTFGLDVSRDVIRAVTGPPRDEALGRRASGSDALSLLSRAQVPDLADLCARLLTAYEADDYKQWFSWIDHLRRVSDPSLIERLNEKLLGAIRTRSLTDMHLAPPEPMSWERLAGFTFSTRRREDLDPDPRISAYLDTVEPIEDLDLQDIKTDRVIAISAETDEPLEAWSVFRCIVFEVTEGNTLYALSAGQWYSVSISFADEVFGFAEALPELQLDLPNASVGVREENYNREAAERTAALCLDQQLITTPIGDRIELCDLLTRQRQLVHIKKRGSSSTLSHLFSQGLVSAELLARESAFRRGAREVIAALDGDFESVVPEGRPSRDEWEVGFVVITRSARDTPLTLPFFSLVNLRSAVLRLNDLGFKVSVRKVEER
jgi:uncharacterized protein (TIGR04141 family)